MKRGAFLLALCAVLFSGIANAAWDCTLIWQAPQQHLEGNPPPTPVNITGPTNFMLSISCPAGVTPPTSYELWAGCMDSGAALVSGYTNPLCAPGTGITSLLPMALNNVTVSGGFVSFNLDLTQLLPAGTEDDVNVTSQGLDSSGNFLAATPRDCPPNNDCDIPVTIGAPGSSPTATPTSPTAPLSAGGPAVSITAPANNATVSGTITASDVGLPATDFSKWYLPNTPINGVCSQGQFDSPSDACVVYGGASSSFNYDTTQLSNGSVGFFVQLFSQANQLDAQVGVSVTVANSAPTLTPTCAVSIAQPYGSTVAPPVTVTLNETNCSGDFNRLQIVNPNGNYHVNFTGTSTTLADQTPGLWTISDSAWSSSSYLTQIGSSNRLAFTVALPPPPP
jgi:hypothetical protein